MTAPGPVAAKVRGFLVAGLVLALLAACGNGPGSGPSASATIPSPLADCTGLAGPLPRPTLPGPTLPGLTLPCFTGGQPVALDRLRGPAVVNLWASWCPPCREELPVLQRYAAATAGQVRVVGVVTEDARDAAASFAQDAGVTFPALYDREGQLFAALGVVGLPATVFVDAGGQVRHVHNAVLERVTLQEYAATHLGVAP